MKKRLAAGLPLAGLLAAAATVGAVAQGCSTGAVMGKMPAPTPEERAPDGDDDAPKTILFPEEFAVTAGLMMLPEEPKDPDSPESAADGPGENAAP